VIVGNKKVGEGISELFHEEVLVSLIHYHVEVLVIGESLVKTFGG
jgi:hypothetical protein